MNSFDTYFSEPIPRISKPKLSSYMVDEGLTYHVTPIGLQGWDTELQWQALTHHDYIYYIIDFWGQQGVQNVQNLLCSFGDPDNFEIIYLRV